MVPGGSQRGAAPAAYSSVLLEKAINSSKDAVVKLIVDDVQPEGTVQAEMSGVITSGTSEPSEKFIAVSDSVVPSAFS